MDVVLVCFSQTGNTAKIATAMAGAFREEGHSARIAPLRNATPEQATEGDLLGVGTPCFSGRAPTPVKTFLRALPRLDGKRAFVFATSSGAPGRVLYDLTSLLRSRGGDVLGGFLARGQVHHPAPHLTGQFTARPNAQDLTHARWFALAVADHVVSSCPSPLHASRPDALRPRWGLYDLMGLVSSDRLLRLFLPEPKPSYARCNRCGWCVRECPVDNITLQTAPYDRAPDKQGALLQSYPVLGERCIRCYRCLTGCPKQVFDVNWRLSGRLLATLYSPTSMRRFGDLRPGEQVY